jgi:hypothetical protein
MGILDNAIRGTKDFTETAKLNSQIADEKKQIQSIYNQIGKLYYETNPHDDSPLGKLCADINKCNKRIEEREKEKLEIKAAKKCSNCGANVAANTAFCVKCGHKLDAPHSQPTVPKKFCTGCGNAMSIDATFCTSCGRQFVIVPPPSAENSSEN